MSNPNSAVDVCNLALDLLKQAPITALTGTELSAVAATCVRWYDQTRREVLRKHPWNFAKKRVELTASATDPEFGYTYAFNVPNDFIRLCTIGDDSIDDIRTQYEVENGQILINGDSNTLKISYIYNCELVSRFDPLFLKCLVLQLAIDLAPRFTTSPATKKELKDDLERTIPWGTAVDGQERPPKRIERSKFLSRRRGSRGSGASPYTVFE